MSVPQREEVAVREPEREGRSVDRKGVAGGAP